MNKRRLNEIAVALEKVNYLYRNMRKSNEPVKRLELALLKKYVLDLYDNILVMEMPDLEMEQHEVMLETPKFEYKPTIITPPTSNEAPKPVVIIENQPTREPAPEIVHPETLTQPLAGIELPKWTQPAADTNNNDSGKSTSLHEWANEDEGSKTQVLNDHRQQDSRPSTKIEKEKVRLVADYSDEDEGETIAINGELNNLLGKQKTVETNNTNNVSSDSIKFPVTFNQRIAFTRELFSNNEKAYHESMKELSEARGYIEALTYINLNLRYDFNWKDNDPTVKEFLEMIKRRFLG